MVSNKSRNGKSSLGSFMVCIVLMVLGIEYYSFAIMTWYPRVGTKLGIYAIPILIVFHFLAFMLMWSFLMTLLTDSGEVPIYWGFRVGDPDDRRRRYCLMGNLYKPERCHHCSAGGRGVLNMDHHGPWVNNGIGFKNRKYFMLLLFYVQITTLFILMCWSLDLIKSVKVIYADIATTKFHYYDLRKAVITIIGYLFVGLIGVMMFFFFKFHRKLVKQNKTTIENIEHNSDPIYLSKYDIDFWHNVYQVMGTNKYLWWIPIMPASNMPPGQGIYFEKNAESEDSSDEAEDNRPNNYQNDNNSENNRSNQNVIERLTNVRDGSGVNHQNGANGTNGESNAQADRMTIHDENHNRWESLNNIVQSDNAGQVYKSNESNENDQREEGKQGNSKFTNTITAQEQESRGKQYFDRSTYGNTSKEKPSIGSGRADGERADSKASTGQLVRKSRGQGSGQKLQQKGSRHVNQVSKEGGRGKTTKKRTTTSSRGRTGAGFR